MAVLLIIGSLRFKFGLIFSEEFFPFKGVYIKFVNDILRCKFVYFPNAEGMVSGVKCGNSSFTYVGSFPLFSRLKPRDFANLSNFSLLIPAGADRRLSNRRFSLLSLFESMVSYVIP